MRDAWPPRAGATYGNLGGRRNGRAPESEETARLLSASDAVAVAVGSRSGRRMHAQGPGASEKRDDVDRGQPGNGRAADSYLLRHAGIGASRKWRSVAVTAEGVRR